MYIEVKVFLLFCSCPPGVHNNCLHFMMSSFNPTEELCRGNLRLFYRSTGGNRNGHRRYTGFRYPMLVRLDIMGIYANSNKTTVVASQTHFISAYESSGWFNVEISKAFEKEAAMVDSQVFLEPKITLYGNDGKVTITTDPQDDTRPILVVYNHEDPSVTDNSLIEALGRARQQQQQANLLRQTAPTPESDDILTNRLLGSRKRRAAQAARKACALHYERIPMSAIGFSNVIQPPYFPMTFCKGSCQHPILQPTRSSLHGRIMSLLNSMGSRRRRAEEPCCAPSGLLAGLDMVYVWPSGGFTIKYHSNMVVENCACS